MKLNCNLLNVFSGSLMAEAFKDLKLCAFDSHLQQGHLVGYRSVRRTLEGEFLVFNSFWLLVLLEHQAAAKRSPQILNHAAFPVARRKSMKAALL